MSGIGDAIHEATGSTVDQPTVAMDALELPSDNGDAADSSVLAAVRLRAAQLAHDNTVELDIPGYGGVLVGRYKAISIAKVYGGPGGTLRNPLTEWGVAADALSRALVGLYGRNENGALEPLLRDQDARYDDELAAALNLEPDGQTARAVLVALLGGGELGESRVWQHFLQYQAWVTEGSAQEVAADAVGEPSTTE
jgi:hypothetical protein